MRDGTPSSDSVKRGSVANGAWKTSTITGWPTSRKPCLSCIRIFMKMLMFVSEKRKRVGYGFEIPKMVLAPNAPRKHDGKQEGQIAA
jgi:hypothetical protein